MSMTEFDRSSFATESALAADFNAQQTHEDLRLMLEVAEVCNEFSRQAQAYLVEPKGLRAKTVEWAKTRRGWKRRHERLMSAHGKWVDVDCRDPQAYHRACVEKAQAAYQLLIFALGTWTIPEHISTPNAAI